MSYIGNQPLYTSYINDRFSGNGSTLSFTLSIAPANSASILVAIFGVLQDPTAYGVVGGTLTFTSAPPTGTNNISVRYLGLPASNVITSAYRVVTDITATAGQTTFSPASYTPGFIDVYRNGARLGTADYVATNGAQVVLNDAAAVGDLLQFDSFSVGSVLNAIPANAGVINSGYLADASVISSKLAGGSVTNVALDIGSGTGSGGMRLPAGTTAQRPAIPSDGMMRRNTTNNTIEYYNGVSAGWSVLSEDKIGYSSGNPAPSATAILTAIPGSPSGYYYIRPDGANVYYVYCDMVTDGGGWMLMINARANNGGQYYSGNDYNLSAFAGFSYPEYNKSTTSMFGTTIMNRFFQMSGFKYGRMTPGPGVTLTSPYTGLYQRIGTTTTAQWGGTAFDASNRAALTGAAYSWVLTQYKNWADAQAATNARVGGYTGANHYYPTTYDAGWQNFWKGDQDGIRFSSGFNLEDYSALGQNTCPGYWWIKTT